MGKFKPSDYTVQNAIYDQLRYESVYVGDNYVMKDHGGYIEVNVDADNIKGHISFDVYYNDDGEITSIIRHN